MGAHRMLQRAISMQLCDGPHAASWALGTLVYLAGRTRHRARRCWLLSWALPIGWKDSPPRRANHKRELGSRLQNRDRASATEFYAHDLPETSAGARDEAGAGWRRLVQCKLIPLAGKSLESPGGHLQNYYTSPTARRKPRRPAR